MTFLLIPPYLIVALIVLFFVVRKQKTAKQKWITGLLLVVVFYLPFGWDVILGRAVFYGLCATQGGVHVYHTVELGPEYWNEDGSPRFILYNGELDEPTFNGRYKYKRVDQGGFLGGSVTKHPDRLIDVENGDVVLADRVTFVYRGGWFSRYTGFFVEGVPCGTDLKDMLYPTFFSKVFLLSK